MLPGPLLALDVGTLTIGLALTDPGRLLARPWKTLSRKGASKDAEALAALCVAEGVTGVVVGLPLGLDGGETRSTRLARQVARALQDRTGLPLAFQDERFSSVEAERLLLEVGHRRQARKERIDQAAAAVILDDFLASPAAATFARSAPSIGERDGGGRG